MWDTLPRWLAPAVPTGWPHPGAMLGVPAELGLTLFLGLCFGSLASLLSWRLPRDLPVGRARSACRACGARLAPASLIPLLSYLWQRGRCHACHAPIGWRYPALELTGAALFALAWWRFGPGLPGWLAALALICLLALAVADAETWILPNELVLALAVLGLIEAWAVRGRPLAALGLAAALLAGIVLIAALFRHLRGVEGIGRGDIKLIGAAGLWLHPLQLGWFLALAGGLAVGLALLHPPPAPTGGASPRPPQAVPFGPALCLSLALMILTG